MTVDGPAVHDPTLDPSRVGYRRKLDGVIAPERRSLCQRVCHVIRVIGSSLVVDNLYDVFHSLAGIGITGHYARESGSVHASGGRKGSQRCLMGYSGRIIGFVPHDGESFQLARIELVTLE